MKGITRIAAAMPARLRASVEARDKDLCEVRLRAGRPTSLILADGTEWMGETVSPEALWSIAGALMEYSMYAWEEELAQGFFTLEDGCRVGISGRMAGGKLDSLADLQAICVRVAREVRGCAEPLVESVLRSGAPESLLLVSRPGLGKTTCLRELARRLSEEGWNVGLADERGELAALRGGVPALDVGPRTDVAALCPKHVAIPYLVRTMAPQVIVTDELGDARDAEAVLDARRCGVAVIASAHAASLEQAVHRPALREMASAFGLVALLEGAPGRIAEIRRMEELPWA